MKKKKITAMFKCVDCGYTWVDNPGPTECPKCGNLYVEWVNYKKLAEEAPKKGWSGFGF